MRSGFQFADRTFEHQMDHLCDTSLLNMVDEFKIDTKRRDTILSLFTNDKLSRNE